MKFRSEEEELHVVAGAACVAEDRMEKARDAVARKLEPFFEYRRYGIPDDVTLSEPTEAEPTALRHRSAEYAVLDERRDELRKRQQWDIFWFQLAGFSLRLLYRLVVLSAAIVILYQYFG